VSFRSTLGNIIIFFAVLGLIINVILVAVLIFPFCSLGVSTSILDDLGFTGTDLSKCAEAYLQFGIGIVVSFVWIGIGVLIRGKKREIFLG